MKILRKRVGSLELNNLNSIKILKDSIFYNNEIIFNYLPIKELKFFYLKLEKSNLNNKHWVFLDLNLDLLHKEIFDGKIIMNRNLIFDLINLSLNRLKINKPQEEFINYINFNEQESNLKNLFEIEKYYGFNKSFVKYGKIYFNLEKKLITLNKCKKNKIDLPSIFIFNNYFEVRKLFLIIASHFKVENSNSLFVINKNDENIIESEVFNPFFGESIKNTIFAEDLNYQMTNYFNEIKENEFLKQLEFESDNFFFKKDNLFIISEKLSDLSISYLSKSNFKRLIVINFKNINSALIKFLRVYDEFRINLNNDKNNLLISNYILSNRTFKYNTINSNLNPIKLDFIRHKVNNFPLGTWTKFSNHHLLSLDSSNPLLTNFIKIGEKDCWSESYLQQIKENPIEAEINCPISLSPLNTFSVKTECNHCFNLISLLKWLKDNEQCPICRKKIEMNNLKFISSPDISDFIKNLYEFEKKNYYSK